MSRLLKLRGSNHATVKAHVLDFFSDALQCDVINASFNQTLFALGGIFAELVAFSAPPLPPPPSPLPPSPPLPSASVRLRVTAAGLGGPSEVDEPQPRGSERKEPEKLVCLFGRCVCFWREPFSFFFFFWKGNQRKTHKKLIGG